ncbi:MAG: Mut7-C RNAse domain-containing protein [Thermoplasmatota archaeon]
MIPRSSEPRLLADEMLGRLARWLRLAGVDVEYAKGESDGVIRDRARASGRFLLTRDVELARRAAPESFLVRSLDPDEQFVEVVAAMDLELPETRWLTRCTACNGTLSAAALAEAAGRVPEGVLAARSAVERCASCGAFYWEGTHATKIRVKLARLLALPKSKE